MGIYDWLITYNEVTILRLKQNGRKIVCNMDTNI